MKKINITSFINSLVRIHFIDNTFFEGYFVKSKDFKNKWNILPLKNSDIYSFCSSHIKSITWLNNDKTIKYSQIDFKELKKED